MALVPSGALIGDHPQAAAAAARKQAAQQHAVTQALYRRRGVGILPDAPPTVQSVLRRHVLQGDFGNVVSSPTGGYVECEVVLDGDTIRIYAPPA